MIKENVNPLLQYCNVQISLENLLQLTIQY